MACDFELPPRIKLDHGTVSTSGETSGDSRGTSVGANTGKKGQPWTESEHLGFLAGLKKLGKGNWRGISRLYVPSRTPTQVASHAQKHFLRLSGVTKRRSRFSTLDQAAGAQSILEAAALAGQAGPSSPEWCSTYPASTPSTHGFSAEHVFLPGSVPSEYTTWRAVPSYYGVLIVLYSSSLEIGHVWLSECWAEFYFVIRQVTGQVYKHLAAKAVVPAISCQQFRNSPCTGLVYVRWK
ncbi:hypothetical protein WJX79_009256 [Trebouxia sp. C0005]